MTGTPYFGRHALALGIAAMLAACGGGDEDAANGTAFDTTAAPPAAAPADSPAASAAATDTAARTIQARLTEWSVALSEDNVPAGRVVIEVTNAGTVEHALEVEGQGMEIETGTIPPGGTARMQADLRPGSYEVYCPVSSGGVNHREQGMVATLIVQ